MALPERIRVKLSSEVAEAISITPVVVQEIATRELVEHMLGITGKDVGRVKELLLRGTLVSGASRFRWSGLEADPAGVEDLLSTFPDPDPERPFRADGCVRVVLKTPGRHIELSREAASRKPLFRRKSFWDVLMGVAGSGCPQYESYSYRDRADRYSLDVSAGVLVVLRENAGLLRFSTVRDQIRRFTVETVELWVERG
jgi:hypothetical protein